MWEQDTQKRAWRSTEHTYSSTTCSHIICRYTWIFQSRKLRLTAKGICCANQATLSICKNLHYFASSGGWSAGLRLWTKSHRVFFVWMLQKGHVKLWIHNWKYHPLYSWLVYILFIYLYNFINCRFHILQHQLGNLIILTKNWSILNYIFSKSVLYCVILHVYFWRWSARLKPVMFLIVCNKQTDSLVHSLHSLYITTKLSCIVLRYRNLDFVSTTGNRT
jgi:hypothetical protein